MAGTIELLFWADQNPTFLRLYSVQLQLLDNTMTRTRAVTTLLVVLCVALLSEAIVK